MCTYGALCRLFSVCWSPRRSKDVTGNFFLLVATVSRSMFDSLTAIQPLAEEKRKKPPRCSDLCSLLRYSQMQPAYRQHHMPLSLPTPSPPSWFCGSGEEQAARPRQVFPLLRFYSANICISCQVVEATRMQQRFRAWRRPPFAFPSVTLRSKFLLGSRLRSSIYDSSLDFIK